MFSWLELCLTIVGSVIASSGFWAFLMKRNDSKSAKTRLLIGLAHDRIIQQGAVYITRRWVTLDEYENLYEYLYKPYSELGGNGSAERVIAKLKTLPHEPPAHQN